MMEDEELQRTLVLVGQFVLLLVFFWPRSLPAADPVDEFNQRFPVNMPHIEGPPGASTAWIAKRMLRDGLPMSIRAFKAKSGIDEVMGHYSHEWRKRALSPRENRQGKRQRILGVLDGDYYMTIQAFPTSQGSEGFIVVTADPAKISPDRKTSFPLPESLRIVRKDEYLDGEIAAETLTAVSDRSQRNEIGEISRHLRTNGWAEVSGPFDGSSLNVQVLEFQKSSQLVQVTVSSDKSLEQTTVLLHWRKN